MQTKPRDVQIVFPLLCESLIVFLSVAAPNMLFKILLIAFGTGGIILFCSKNIITDENKRRVVLIVDAAAFTAILIWSVAAAGSLSAYGEKLQNFFQDKAFKSLEAVYEEVNGKDALMERKISEIDEKAAQIIGEIELSSAAMAEREFLSGRDDSKEVESAVNFIKKKLDEDAKDEDPSFTNIKTDVNVVELFYKMRVTRELYQYSNCIKAMESVGIDCKAMSIDEYTLMLWDAECLFTIFQMRQSVLEDAAQDVVYESQQLYYYQTFKLLHMNEYSDTFDYGNWRKWFDPQPAKKTAASLDSDIMRYYRKFCMNFSKDTD